MNRSRIVTRRNGVIIGTIIVLGGAAGGVVVDKNFNNPDRSPPVVRITSPLNNDVLTGSATLEASCNDNRGCSSVQMTVNGEPFGTPEVHSSPSPTDTSFTIDFDSAAISDGAQTIGAIATDASGNHKTARDRHVVVGNARDNIFISADGDDDGENCTRTSSPEVTTDPTTVCRTPEKAWSLAHCADGVGVLPGNYASATISAPKACAADTEVKFIGTGIPPVFAQFTVMTNYVWLENLAVPHALDADTVGAFSITSPCCAPPDVHDVTWKNLEGGSFFIVGDDINVLGGSFGGFSACLTNVEDIGRVWQLSDSMGMYHASNRVLFDGVTIHDGTDNGDICAGTAGAGLHVDCLQFLGGHYITVQNSFFYHCPTSDIIGSGFRTGEDHWVIQNNFFGEVLHPGAALNFGYSGNPVTHLGDPPTGVGNVIRYNTTPGTISADCTLDSTGCWDVYGNIGGYATCNPVMSTWENNRIGNFCVNGTSTSCTPTFDHGPPATGSYGSADVPNLDLSPSDTCARNTITTGAGSYPATDFYSTARPQGTKLDAGADEVPGGGD